MKSSRYSLLISFLVGVTVSLNAQQDILLFENFNNCGLPNGWEVQIEGNQDVVWYIGTPLNPSSDSSSIDGSCMVIIDDDATGDNTPGFVWTMTSPYFEMDRYTTVNFSADVHMRNYDLEQFTIYLEDEEGRRIIQRFEERNFAGTQFSQFVPIRFDLVFFESKRARLVFEYNDNSTWGWWVGFDNILVTGEGSGDLLLLENFNECSTPSGWTSQVESGDEPWQIGIVDNSNAGNNNSMNGSCFLYFDDDGIGQDAAPSQVTMISPSFDGIEYARYELQFDLIFRTYSGNEYLEIGVLNSRGSHPVQIISSQVGGDRFNVNERMSIDLSAYKDDQIQVYFRYDDGSSWNWWVGIDNVKVIGEGSINDFCYKSLPIEEGICNTFDMKLAYAAGDVSFHCNEEPSATLWYSFSNPSNRVAEFALEGGGFNDVLEVFRGNDCSQLDLIHCQDRDEYGFVGERLRLSLTPGQYYIRASGKQAEFGKSRGEGCIIVREVENIILPADHGTCEDAFQIAQDQECIPIHNHHAANPEILPIANERARADVWLQFTPEEIADWKIHTSADFADMITVYKGTCQQMEEYQSNEQGLELLVTGAEVGETYFIQWSGYFSSLEGNACFHIEKVEIAEEHVDCFTALPVGEGNSPGVSNTGVGMSERAPSCDPLATSDVWYRFTAEFSGAIYVRNRSEFISTLAIYSGECDSLQSIYCDKLKHGCEGFSRVPGLQAGKEYLVQIASRGRVPGQNQGLASFEWVYAQNYVPYVPVEVQAEAFCVSKNAAAVTPSAEGGSGSYFFESNAVENTLYSLQQYFVEVTDSDGCIDYTKGTMPDCSETDCNVFFDANVIVPTCHDESDGAIELTFNGGVGPYTYDLNGAIGEEDLITGLSVGEYLLSLVDAGGCREEFTISIPNPELLLYDVVLVEHSSGNDGVIQLQITGGMAPYDVTWYKNGDLTDLSGLIISNLTEGEYQAHVLDANGCLIISETIVVELSTSVAYQTDVTGLRIFPNPADNQLNLSFKANFNGYWNLQILDRLGRTAYSESIHMSEKGFQQIPIQSLTPGLYFLQLSRDEIVYTLKFVKI